MIITPLHSPEEIRAENPPVPTPPEPTVITEPQPEAEPSALEPLALTYAPALPANNPLIIDSVTPPSKRRGKKIAVASALLLLIGIGAGGYYFYTNVPLKRDYVAANVTYTSVITTSDSIVGDAAKGALVMDGTLDESSISTEVSNQKFGDIDTKLTEFSQSNVMKDKDVADTFNAFQAKYGKFKQMYKEVVLEGYGLVANYRTQCGGLSSPSTQTKMRNARTTTELQAVLTSVMQPCLAALELLKGAQSDAFVTYGTNALAIVTSINSDLTAIVYSKTTAERTALQAKMTTSLQALSAEGTTFIANLSKTIQDSSPKDELAALKTALANAQSKAIL